MKKKTSIEKRRRVRLESNLASPSQSTNVVGLFFENLADGVTVKQLAHKIRIPEKTVYDWIYRDTMPNNCILRINGRVRLNGKAVEAWLVSQQR
jgi:hypothetical protein